MAPKAGSGSGVEARLFHPRVRPGDGLAVQVLGFPLAGPPVARLLACMCPLRPLDSRFPTQDLSRAPRPSSLLFLCPSYSNSKAQFLEIELIFGRRLARDFQHKLQNSGRKRVKRPGNSAHRSEDDLHERAGREPRNGRRKGSRGHDPAG